MEAIPFLFGILKVQRLACENRVLLSKKIVLDESPLFRDLYDKLKILDLVEDPSCCWVNVVVSMESCEIAKHGPSIIH